MADNARTHGRLRPVVILGVLLVFAFGVRCNLGEPFDLVLSLDKAEYALGELPIVTLAVANRSGEELRVPDPLKFRQNYQLWFRATKDGRSIRPYVANFILAPETELFFENVVASGTTFSFAHRAIEVDFGQGEKYRAVAQSLPIPLLPSTLIPRGLLIAHYLPVSNKYGTEDGEQRVLPFDGPGEYTLRVTARVAYQVADGRISIAWPTSNEFRFSLR